MMQCSKVYVQRNVVFVVGCFQSVTPRVFGNTGVRIVLSTKPGARTASRYSQSTWAWGIIQFRLGLYKVPVDRHPRQGSYVDGVRPLSLLAVFGSEAPLRHVDRKTRPGIWRRERRRQKGKG